VVCNDDDDDDNDDDDDDSTFRYVNINYSVDFPSMNLHEFI